MVDMLINSAKIKYTVLEELFKDIEIKEDLVTFYVDLHSVIYRMYIKDFNASIASHDDLTVSLVVNICNVLSHYRRFFTTRLKKKSRIVVLFNDKIPDFQSSKIFYGKRYYDKYSHANIDYCHINCVMEKVLEYLKEIIPYFNGVYILEHERIEEMNMISYCKEYFSANTNSIKSFDIIYSNNEMMYQFVEDSIVLYPKRDKSFIITKDNFYDKILADKKFRPKYINYKMWSIILAIVGVSKRDVEPVNVHGLVRVMKLLDLMIEEEFITNDVSMGSFVKVLGSLLKLEESDEELLLKRYLALSESLGKSWILSKKSIRHLVESRTFSKISDKGLYEINESLIGSSGKIIELEYLTSNYRKSTKVDWLR